MKGDKIAIEALKAITSRNSEILIMAIDRTSDVLELISDRGITVSVANMGYKG